VQVQVRVGEVMTHCPLSSAEALEGKKKGSSVVTRASRSSCKLPGSSSARVGGWPYHLPRPTAPLPLHHLHYGHSLQHHSRPLYSTTLVVQHHSAAATPSTAARPTTPPPHSPTANPPPLALRPSLSSAGSRAPLTLTSYLKPIPPPPLPHRLSLTLLHRRYLFLPLFLSTPRPNLSGFSCFNKFALRRPLPTVSPSALFN
jgi:hypothetical protein